MIQQTRRYGFVKSLVFTCADVAISTGNNHVSYTFDFKGILKPPFYIVGASYEPHVFDKNIGVTDKWFNYNDPLVQNRMQILMQSTDNIIGDNIDLSISGGAWLRFLTGFSAGVVYNFMDFPLVIPETTIYINFDNFIDPSYTPTQLWVTQYFSLFIGTDMPIKLAGGEVIPPPVIDFP